MANRQRNEPTNPEKIKATLDALLISLGINSPLARQQFTNKAAIIELPKNTVLFKTGGANSKEYLLLEGIMHRYNLSEKGTMITTGFYLPGSVVTPHFARTNKGKSIFSMQALTNAVLAAIPVAELDVLRNNNTDFRDFGQRVVEKELSTALQLDVAFRSFSAKERLLSMRQQYPHIENEVPHPVIASYLGITNVSFSRLRKELSVKHDFIK